MSGNEWYDEWYKNKNKNTDLFIVDFSKIVNISARAIFRHEMMGMYR